MKKILITGGCGFIGSNFVRHVLNNHNYEIINLDCLTYAGNPANLKNIDKTAPYTFIHGAIEDEKKVNEIFSTNDIWAVINFAAESHVDRSIENARPFITTNVAGLETLLRLARKANIERFIHISTDEVYGSLETTEGLFTESTPLAPSSPYSASKAAGDFLINAYIKTYNFPAIIARPSNNYGPYQYPEKFIPLMVTNILTNLLIPVYGKGQNIRDWLYVEDTCQAIATILKDGKIGEVYNVGGENEVKNIDLVHMVLDLMEKDSSNIKYVTDRLGHDYRYGLDCQKIKSALGWTPVTNFKEGLIKTINFYVENTSWWEPLKK